MTLYRRDRCKAEISKPQVALIRGLGIVIADRRYELCQQCYGDLKEWLKSTNPIPKS